MMKSRALLRLGAGCSLLALPLSAVAFPFDLGPVKGSFDTTVSVGAAMRMQSPDGNLVGAANGGTSRTPNEDDGNLGFAKHDLVSATAKASHDIELKWKNFGAFSRVTYFYDGIATHARHREDRMNAMGNPTSDRKGGSFELGPEGRDRLGSELDFLDLFAYANFNVGGVGVSTRFGKQVVSWGESTFIGNSINSINPIDVSKIRAPGAELKEALIPTAMLWNSLQVGGGVSLESVWMTSYESTRIDPRGSFFSTNDFLSDDGDKAYLSFGRREDDGHTLRSPIAANGGSASVWAPRDAGRKVASATKQYGFALRYMADWLHSTELGAYYLTYHSRTPLASGIAGGGTSSQRGTNLLTQALPTCSSQATPTAPCRGTYFSEYPSNIKLYGLSFNTTGPAGIALQGEYSYRPNMPLQLASPELLLAALGVPSTVSATPIAAGSYIKGYRRVDMHQVQATATKLFGPTFGAQQFTMVGEVGTTHLNLPDGLKFNGPGVALPSCGPFRALPAGNQAAISGGSCQEEVGGGYATKDSWGYRIVSRLDYENAIGAAQLSPRIIFAHDVAGVGPSFNRDTKAITFGLALNYLQRWQADIGYTTFQGGRVFAGTDAVPPGTVLAAGPPPTFVPGDATQSASFATGSNQSKDRDFLAVSVSYAF